MKISSVIGPVALFLICVVLIVAGLFWFWPQESARATGFGPYDGMGIALYCSLLVIVIGGAAWLIERVFERAGKTGLYVTWRKNLLSYGQTSAPVNHTDEEISQFSPDLITEHLRFRYGRRWQRKVRILLVQGDKEETEQVAPGLCQDLWQEADGSLLIYGGDGCSPADVFFSASLKRLRSGNPLDGIVQILDSAALPADTKRDALLRCRQKADALLGWQVPVWLWLTDKERWPQQERQHIATGVMFGPGAKPEAASASLDVLALRLQTAGMVQLLNDSRHDWLLRLSSRLRGELKNELTILFGGLMQGAAALRLRGVMFSPELTVAGAPASIRVANTRTETTTWKAVIDDCAAVSSRKITVDWLKTLHFLLLAGVIFWGMGTLLSLAVNRTQIYQEQQTARTAADTTRPLAERLRNQLMLQQAIARLQHRQHTGAPWYTRFGLNKDGDTLAALWPLYARNNKQLMGNASAAHLGGELDRFIRLSPASDARTQGKQQAYHLLKAYLMLARPDKADADWLAKNALTLWPARQGVADSTWQDLAPKLLGFWMQNLPAHPEWKIAPDAELVSTVRQILLKQIVQSNAESGLYQAMLKRIASNWPDLQLADLTGDTDAATLFSTKVVVPGVFTRQAWEEQVRGAIDEVVKTRRDEIDWVLTDKTSQQDDDVSPQALKAKLTERYFTDFGNAWLEMVNSITWHRVASLTDAIAQLNLLADARQSPLIALMNTLAWQGKTGQKSAALTDTLVDSAKQLIGVKKEVRQLIGQVREQEAPLDRVFAPLIGLMEGKEGAGSDGSLSFRSWLARVTQVRLKLQQITSAADPQSVAQMLAQTVFQGKTDLSDTQDYGSLVAASLGQQWNGFGQSLFVQPLDLAWHKVLAPAAGSLNRRWQTAIVDQWNIAFEGRYPFDDTGSEASLPLLTQFLRTDSGHIALFLKNNLGGLLHQEGNRWVANAVADQGIKISPGFLDAMNELAEIAGIAFARGDAGVRFELMARPSRDVARMQLSLDEQKLDYFNQLESWQSFIWPGNTYYPGVSLSWRSVSTGMQLYASHKGNWGFIRLLEQAEITPLDTSRMELVWKTTDSKPLKFVLRTELAEGPLALLKFRGFRLPESIFSVNPVSEDMP